MLAYTLHKHTQTVYREHSITERCSVRGVAFHVQVCALLYRYTSRRLQKLNAGKILSLFSGCLVMILFSILTNLNAKNLRVCRCAGFIRTACPCFLQYAHACREAPCRRKEIIFIYECCKIKKVLFFSFLFLSFFFRLCFIREYLCTETILRCPVFRG